MLLLLVRLRSRLRAIQTVLEGRGCEAIATCRGVNRKIWNALKSGLFKVRIEGKYPFSTEGAREAQKDLTTPGGKLAGKILIKIADE